MTKKTRRGFCACNTVCFRCCCRHLHLPSLLYSHKVLPSAVYVRAVWRRYRRGGLRSSKCGLVRERPVFFRGARRPRQGDAIRGRDARRCHGQLDVVYAARRHLWAGGMRVRESRGCVGRHDYVPAARRLFRAGSIQDRVGMAKSADDSQLVVDGKVRAVVKLYDELKNVRYRTSTDRTHNIHIRPIPRSCRELFE